MTTTAICSECDRIFDLHDPDRAAEFAYGHDCEPGTPDTVDAPIVAVRVDRDDTLWTVVLTDANGVEWPIAHGPRGGDDGASMGDVYRELHDLPKDNA